jgi:transcriptional regulator with PAS, ATPase and Fis domain
MIVHTPKGVMLRDLDSKNGTFVDRVRIGAAYIDSRSDITLGSTKLRMEIASAKQTLALSRGQSFGAALGASLQMRALFALLQRAALTHETVLLLGESGTGKELLARAIHDASPRASGPFAVFDCSAVVPTLVEAELFGYVKGAFTGANNNTPGLFEQARGGTVFIDELGELPLDLQPKLLRAIESRHIRRVGSVEWTPIDVRIVAATHRDLRARVATGTFRMDLYYRLAVVEGAVPPLRERPEDIELLVEHFLASQSPPRTLADLPPNTLAMLRNHQWPGNVRELRNTITRLMLFPERPGFDAMPTATAQPAAQPSVMHLPLREARDLVVEQFEQQYLTSRLAEHNGNVSRAAEAMGVSRQFLHRLLERHGIDR